MTDAVADVTGVNASIAFGTLLATGDGVIGVVGIELAIEEGSAIAVGECIVAITGSGLVMGQGTLLATGGALAVFSSPDLVMGHGSLLLLLQSPIKIFGISAAIEEGTLFVGTNARALVVGPNSERHIRFYAGAITIARGAIATLFIAPIGGMFTSRMRIRAGFIRVSTVGSSALSGIGMTAAAGSVVSFSAATIYGIGMSIRAGVLAPFSKGVVTSSDSLVDIVDGDDAAVRCISMADSLIATVTAGNE